MYFKSRKASLLLFSLMLGFFAGCSTISNIYPQIEYKIVVLSDIHITNSESKDNRLKAFFEEINNNKYPGVDLVITCGDNVSSIYDRYTPDSTYTGYNRLQRFMDIISTLKVPWYLTIGNHEYKIEKARDSDAPYTKDELVKMEQIWQDITGFKPYYSVIHKGWKLIFLNSMSARDQEGYFDQKQLDWLAGELDNILPTLLFFHHPVESDNFRIWKSPWHATGPLEEPRFYEIVKAHKDHIKGMFVGHGHMWVQDKLYDQIDVFETASFGDDESSPHLIIGLNSKTKSISVARSPIQFSGEM